MAAYYLKYRSQNLEELDLTSVRESLENILKSKNIPHAFLFSGPKGTGKTSAARIVAKVLNCTNIKKGSVTPCNKCAQCKSISAGNNIDVVELDAASNRGIDDIRSLRDSVKLSTISATKKVYIIDEAHMLTAEASNALLKTLEEPPEHVVFILATTNPEKLIPTIRSRTTIVLFNKAGTDEVVRALKRAAKKEGLKVKSEVLEIIAEHSGGSFRDAMKDLESLVNEKVRLNIKTVKDYYLSGKSGDTEKLIQSFEKKDLEKLLAAIKSIADAGGDISAVQRELIVYFRQMLLKSASGEETLLNTNDLIYLLNLLQDAQDKLKSAVIDSLPLEIAAITWCEDSVSNKKILRQPQDDSSDEGIISRVSKGKSAPAEKREAKIDSAENHSNDSSSNGHINGHTAVLNGNGNLENKIDITDDVWKNLLVSVRPFNASTEALLRAAKPIGHDGKVLTIGVYYKFHKEQLEEMAHRRIVEDVAGELLGCPTKVACILTSPPQIIKEAEPPKPQNGQAQVYGNGKMTQTVTKQSSSGLLTEEEDEDIMKIAKEVFEI